MLTLEQLQKMPPKTVFASGVIENSPDGVYMTSNDPGRLLRWAARRGGIHDWAIYILWAERTQEEVLSFGDKVTTEGNIKKLVPCDDEAFKMYRF